MLSFSIIGCGAAGNKAVIDLLDMGYDPDKCYMLNSTNKDLPDEYKNNVIVFGKSSNGLGGCGKERSIGREMLLTDLKNGSIDLDRMVDSKDQAIVLVGSTEGGSGSSSLPILAKYFKQVHNKNVICVFFFGFNDDVRGMQNSIELCQELSEEYTVIAISNEKFLNECDGNKFKAERKANALFCDIIKVLTGLMIKPGTQMIDDTDLYKVVTTPGYMIANTMSFSRPKTKEGYMSTLSSFLTSQGFIDPSKNPGAKRIGMIFDIPDQDDVIDYTGSTLRKLYGEPYEFFTHMSDNSNEYRISFIVSGMKLPIEEIVNIYNSYVELTSRVNKNKDDFFEIIGEMRGDTKDKFFDMLGKSASGNIDNNKKDFFSDFGKDMPSNDTKKSADSKDDFLNQFDY